MTNIVKIYKLSFRICKIGACYVGSLGALCACMKKKMNIFDYQKGISSKIV